MKHAIKALLTSLLLMASIHTTHAAPTHDDIRRTLVDAGLVVPIADISPSPIASLTQLNLTGDLEPLLITDNLTYIIQGNIETNPSPITPMREQISTGKAGTPISPSHKAALLANMSHLKNISEQTVFYHTNVDGLLWGMSGGGTAFLVSNDGRYFINGEISVIKDGRLAGLDDDFESTKNRHVFAQLDESGLAIYPAKGQAIGTLYVATDIHCPYCRIFHNKINELNDKGITIKAIGYPVYDESHAPMSRIWCESDNAKRATLLTAAMKGIHTKKDCQNPNNLLTANQQTAHALAVFATPAIFHENGTLFEGQIETNEILNFIHAQNARR